MNKGKYAVITGDIVGSSMLTDKQNNKLNIKLKELFITLKKDQKKNGLLRSIEIYRGDSFQMVTNMPNQALRIALMIRCFLRSTDLETKGKQKSILTFTKRVDARIAIGIGPVSLLKLKLAESTGDAFTLSGHLLDKMLNEKHLKIGIRTHDKQLNANLWRECLLLSAIITKWSSLQCEVVFEKLAGHTEVEIAKKFKTSQPAINFRSQTANWQAIDYYLRWFEDTAFDILQ
ncbi:MAG: hypothetical protein ABI763_10690 [Bacteroidota bacterium]